MRSVYALAFPCHLSSMDWIGKEICQVSSAITEQPGRFPTKYHQSSEYQAPAVSATSFRGKSSPMPNHPGTGHKATARPKRFFHAVLPRLATAAPAANRRRCGFTGSVQTPRTTICWHFAQKMTMRAPSHHDDPLRTLSANCWTAPHRPLCRDGVIRNGEYATMPKAFSFKVRADGGGSHRGKGT